MSISVLIVDDDGVKRELLVSELLKCGVLREDITEITCAVDCRRILDDRAFDLLLLDLVLPNRAGDTGVSPLRVR